MSKIVQAINSMIANPYLISNVVRPNQETFFLYKGKYKWSMAQREDGYHLWFYPSDDPLNFLSSIGDDEWGYHDVPMVHYHDKDIGTKEARASFVELYTLLAEKVFGIDEVLDDIISDEEEL